MHALLPRLRLILRFAFLPLGGVGAVVACCSLTRARKLFGKGKAKTDREQNMNKQRKILTVVALAVFGAIIGLHYVGFYNGIPELHSAAKNAGVCNYALFNDAGYRGLYRMHLSDLLKHKKCRPVPSYTITLEPLS
jgi:hypothetical protein